MKRRSLLVGACFFGALSVGLNIYYYFLKREPHATGAPAQEAAAAPAVSGGDVPVRQMGPAPALPGGKFDFSDTAFADDSWKLEAPKSAVSLDKPFDWEDVNPAKAKDGGSVAGDPAKLPANSPTPSPAPPK
jgi:hypothetical protein